jgi:hypothetical protein
MTDRRTMLVSLRRLAKSCYVLISQYLVTVCNNTLGDRLQADLSESPILFGGNWTGRIRVQRLTYLRRETADLPALIQIE